MTLHGTAPANGWITLMLGGAAHHGVDHDASVFVDAVSVTVE